MTSILGIATSVPPYRLDWHASARFAEATSGIDATRSRQVAALYRRSGIKRRGSVLLDARSQSEIVNEFYPPAVSVDDRGPSTKCRNDKYSIEAPKLALQAAQNALRQSGKEAREVTHLITVTCTGFSAPGVDIDLIDGLNLPPSTQRVQIGFMGCHGAINGLRAGQGLATADPDAVILICSVELCSLHYQYGHQTDRIVSGAIFADGAAAMVLASGQASESWGVPAASGSYLVPHSREAMTWQIGDHGYVMTLSPQVPQLIEEQLEGFLKSWLNRHDCSTSEIGGWAVHPGGMRILGAVESALDLPTAALQTSREVLSEHGNMSSATMLFILERFIQTNQPKPWLMLGFGPGLEIEVALIR
ncbi:MAG: type III polyketide synthase [Pirellulales bacterium]|nr:type III polyketide synthase [Pirellulales bacterium]